MSPSIEELASKVVSVAGELTGMSPQPMPAKSDLNILAAGAAAGLVVDTSLFPIDTIKSRLQSQAGFFKSGGFSNLYRGLVPVLSGSIPNAALFFITYETVKEKMHHYKVFGPLGNGHILSHVIAASLGEVVSCTVRVPYEVLKTRSQTTLGKQFSNLSILRQIIAKEGFVGLYRGYSCTVIRDLPFSAIQYPIWEGLKASHLRKHEKPASVAQSACYGSLAGGIAAFVTNPLDVAKTRIMLAEQSDSLASGKVLQALRAIYSEKGVGGLFAGCVPRVIWISVGAAIFLGTYEKTMKVLG